MKRVALKDVVMKRIWLCSMSVAVALSVAACGNTSDSDEDPGDPVGGGGGGGGPESLGEFVAAVGRAYCERLFRCTEAGEGVLVARLLFASQADCETYVVALNERTAPMRDLEARLEAGLVTYVPEAVAGCVADVGACHGANSFGDPPCRAVFSGTVPEGGMCSRSEVCAGDAYCELDGACPGQCSARKAAGAACDGDDECAHAGGLTFCDFDAPGGAQCASVQLTETAGAGQACTVRAGGGVELVPCDDGWWCDSVDGVSASGTCRAPIPLGDACDSTSDLCDGGLCDTGTETCRAFAIRRGAGEPCDEAQDIVCDPLARLLCVDGTCQGGGDGSAGSRCFQGEFQSPCAKGLYCAPIDTESSEGTCAPLLAGGSACDSNYGCESGLCDTVCAAAYCAY